MTNSHQQNGFPQIQWDRCRSLSLLVTIDSMPPEICAHLLTPFVLTPFFCLAHLYIFDIQNIAQLAKIPLYRCGERHKNNNGQSPLPSNLYFTASRACPGAEGGEVGRLNHERTGQHNQRYIIIEIICLLWWRRCVELIPGLLELWGKGQDWRPRREIGGHALPHFPHLAECLQRVAKERRRGGDDHAAKNSAQGYGNCAIALSGRGPILPLLYINNHRRRYMGRRGNLCVVLATGHMTQNRAWTGDFNRQWR